MCLLQKFVDVVWMTRYDLVDFARINIFDISIFLVYLSLEDAINCFNNEGRKQLFFCMNQ